jgi:hypothetical protein
MAASDARSAGRATGARIHPSAWLIAPTVALLFGQALAAGPWHLGLEAGVVFLVPIVLFLSPRRRRWGILLALGLLTLFLGYTRHRQIL